MNPRFQAIRQISERKPSSREEKKLSLDEFGHLAFTQAIIEKVLPKKISAHMLQAIEGKAKINPLLADAIASAMKDWAIANGATHYCHWFQPMTGHSVQKHDSFFDLGPSQEPIEKFSGKHLLRGEPDASSFPSGGLRSTSEARGYTTWDPSVPAFLWKSAKGKVLCIPSVFFSWTGEALDMKIPLLRSEAKINAAALRLLRHLGITAESVFSTLGCEQEYFLIDRSYYHLRPDLVLCGRTVYGAPPAKGQELEDHYFGTIKERFLSFMQEFEEEAFYLGIPLKTRHSEVAPGQFEVAPIFEKSSLGIDHNIMIMELMRQIAPRHELACLFHEKPFAGINGSGKHNNWSLSTDKGLNLLDPTIAPENNLLFLIVLSAVIMAVDKHADLLRASVASNGNDHRLGGNEAPPAIISIYLGESLEKLLENIEKETPHSASEEKKYNLGIESLAEIPRDTTDRNRTSPFAFTGNKFEFRAVGSSANCSFPMTVLNSIVAESLHLIVDEIEKNLEDKKTDSPEVFKKAAMPVVRRFLESHKRVRFLGNNYSDFWREEAKRRGLPVIEKSLDAFYVLREKKAAKAFEGVLSKEEIESRLEVLVEHYCKVLHVETKLMIELFRTSVLPAALEHQTKVAKSIQRLQQIGISETGQQMRLCKELHELINYAIDAVNHLEAALEKTETAHSSDKVQMYSDKVFSQHAQVRKAVDALEKAVDDRLWPLPKYFELLYIV